MNKHYAHDVSYDNYYKIFFHFLTLCLQHIANSLLEVYLQFGSFFDWLAFVLGITYYKKGLQMCFLFDNNPSQICVCACVYVRRSCTLRTSAKSSKGNMKFPVLLRPVATAQLSVSERGVVMWFCSMPSSQRQFQQDVKDRCRVHFSSEILT